REGAAGAAHDRDPLERGASCQTLTLDCTQPAVEPVLPRRSPRPAVHDLDHVEHGAPDVGSRVVDALEVIALESGAQEILLEHLGYRQRLAPCTGCAQATADSLDPHAQISGV